MKQYSGKSAAKSWQGRVNRAQGGYFEDRIKNGCQKYRDQGRADVDKVPEPFHVIKRLSGLQFVGNFVGRAQPDFAGTLIGGRAIRFEAKHTDTSKMNKSEVKDHQAKALAGHYKMGAATGVCVGIKLQTFFVPWAIWNDMERIFGRRYVTAQDLRQYEVQFDTKNNAVLFLDFVGLGDNPSRAIAAEKENIQRRMK
ncbi:Holliday junction resolvase RecU [Anaeromassilibacillus senegalensis]|uniref:Holliday junction resolvase RecU n=1 Tax=Anaeromassilibacillus senegalensis TaxID=1673717 RepID=UPI000682DF3E|nr:Holliday junction resolvase RecU [Anaeromassilibacillus senegalensis]